MTRSQAPRIRRRRAGVAAWLSAALIAGASVASATLLVNRASLLWSRLSAGGGLVGNRALTAQTFLGQPISGFATNGAVSLVGGIEPTAAPPQPGQAIVTIKGTVRDLAPPKLVTVNGRPAAVTPVSPDRYAYSAQVALTEGINAITVIAIDPLNRSTLRSIRLILDTEPPPPPTLTGPSTLPQATSYQLSGAKPPGTSLWVNGVEVVPLNDETAWTVADLRLPKGVDTVVIVAKDAAGNESTPVTVIILLDTTPPPLEVLIPALGSTVTGATE